MDGPAPARPDARARPAVAQRGVRARLPPGALARQPLPRRLRLPASRRRASRGGPARPVGLAQGRRRSGPQPRQAPAPRGVRGCRRERLPADRDFVLVARPEARELADRDGVEGVRAALADLVGARPVSRRASRGVTCAASRRADPPLPARDLAGDSRALQVRADVLGLRRAGDRASSAYSAGWCSPPGGCCAATRGATAAWTPWRTSALPRAAPARDHAPMTTPSPTSSSRSSTSSSGPRFFHDNVGAARWGLSIIALTRRARGDPARSRSSSSSRCRRLQQLAPEIKALQEKYKGDKQRLERGDDEVLPREQGQPVRARASRSAAAAGLPLALLHAAQGPEDRHLRARAAIAAVPASGTSIANIGCEKVDPGSASSSSSRT